MLDKVFTSMYDSTAGITLQTFLVCVCTALVLGLAVSLASGFRSRCSASFLMTLALLPAIVTVVIMLVNGNLGAGVAVAGTFSLVRFRSVPGTAREIGAIFLAMAVGLACGMGFPVFAAVFTAILCGVMLLFCLCNFGQRRDFRLRKRLQVTVPEDLDYGALFDDLFATYTTRADLIAVKTTNLGSLNRLTYEIVLRQPGVEKAMIDAMRCRNGNLEISLSVMSTEAGEL